MHLGNALSALLAWLQMRSCGGQIVLRLEDLDRARCKPDYAAWLLEDMAWLGLDWDEGPDVGGPHGPYRQSERMVRYEEALARLRELGLLYPCFCSRADLRSLANAPHGLSAEGPAYPGTCRRLTPEQRRQKEEAGKRPSLRFRMPDRPVRFHDGVCGPQEFAPPAGGDFVVKRADGFIGYQLAVVVDDIAMAITDVFRGRDLLDSTPRQLALYEALGRQPPAFAHGPLLYGADGARLSKRHGSVSLAELRENGVTAEQIVGFLAWHARLLDRPEPVAPRDLIPLFRHERLPCRDIVLSAGELERLASGSWPG
jgi:glutamyl-tRNA synthetase